MERNSGKLIKLLEKDGWCRARQKRSHLQLKHPGKTGRVTVPHPEKDLKPGTGASIYKQAG